MTGELQSLYIVLQDLFYLLSGKAATMYTSIWLGLYMQEWNPQSIYNALVAKTLTISTPRWFHRRRQFNLSRHPSPPKKGIFNHNTKILLTKDIFIRLNERTQYIHNRIPKIKDKSKLRNWIEI